MTALVGVVLVCALVQSVFGIGLLVFGTPALLLLGYPFPAALFHLLPCSILISSLQLREDLPLARGMMKDYLSFLAPAAALGAAFVFWYGGHFNVRPLVGAMLLASALLRLSERLRSHVTRRLAPHLRPSLAAIGLGHGLTNMGGGLLTALVNTLFVEKAAVRANIALGYLLMAVLQLSLLLVLKGPQGSLGTLLGLLAVTQAAYMTLGRRAFAFSSQLVYQHGMTVLMAAAGALLLV